MQDNAAVHGTPICGRKVRGLQGSIRPPCGQRPDPGHIRFTFRRGHLGSGSGRDPSVYESTGSEKSHDQRGSPEEGMGLLCNLCDDDEADQGSDFMRREIRR